MIRRHEELSHDRPLLDGTVKSTFMEGTAVTRLEFRYSSFSVNGEQACADILAKGLRRIHYCPVLQCSRAVRRPGSGASIQFYVAASGIGLASQPAMTTPTAGRLSFLDESVTVHSNEVWARNEGNT
jgi:hypothetical protein